MITPSAGDEAGEAAEGSHDVLDVLITVEVVFLDVGYDRDTRAEVVEAVVELARLGHEHLAGPRAAAAAELRHCAADDEAGVGAAAGQGEGDHCRGGGLAVGPRDGDAV